MTVERVGFFQKYIGLSSDEKPLPNDNVPISLLEGAEFFETDTYKTYVWNGTEWILKSSLGRFWDENSSEFKGYYFNADAPQICSQPYLFAVAEGDISGHEGFSKYGRVTLGAKVPTDCWPLGGTYVFPSTAGQGMRIISSSTKDTSTGTGAEKIKIDYLDNTYTARTTEITMNGQTAVTAATTDMSRINRIFVSEAGTDYVSAGNIDVYSTASTTPSYARIESNLTQSRQMIYTVPSGKTLYVTSARYSAGVSTANKLQYAIFTFVASVDPDSGAKSTLFYPYGETGLLNDAIELQLEAPTKIPETCDIKVKIQGDTTEGAVCTAALRGWIE